MVNKIYKCLWCQYEFERNVNKTEGEIDMKKGKYGKKGTVSDQVACPKCNNFLKTWD